MSDMANVIVSPYFRHWISYDGNFRLFRKMKVVDLLDISFSDGLAYFSLKEPYRNWISSVPEAARDVSPTVFLVESSLMIYLGTARL